MCSDSDYSQYENDAEYEFSYSQELENPEFVDADEGADEYEVEDYVVEEEEQEDDRETVYSSSEPEPEPEPEPETSAEVKEKKEKKEKKERSLAEEERDAWKEIQLKAAENADAEQDAEAAKKEKGPGFGEKLKGWTAALGSFLKKKKKPETEGGQEENAGLENGAEQNEGAGAETASVENAQETPTDPAVKSGGGLKALAEKTVGSMKSFFARKKKETQDQDASEGVLEDGAQDVSDEEALAAVEESVKKAAKPKSGIARAVEEETAAGAAVKKGAKPEKLKRSEKPEKPEKPKTESAGVPGIPSQTAEQLAREKRKTYLILGSAFVGLTALALLALVLLLVGGSGNENGEKIASAENGAENGAEIGTEGTQEPSAADADSTKKEDAFSLDLSLPSATPQAGETGTDGIAGTAEANEFPADGLENELEDSLTGTSELDEMSSEFDAQMDPEDSLEAQVSLGTDTGSAAEAGLSDTAPEQADGLENELGTEEDLTALLPDTETDVTGVSDPNLPEDTQTLRPSQENETADTAEQLPTALDGISQSEQDPEETSSEEMKEAPKFPRTESDPELSEDMVAPGGEGFESNVWDEAQNSDLLEQESAVSDVLPNAAETPAAETPDAETPGALDDSLDVGELSDSETPDAETPGTETSDAETPAADGLGGLGDSLDVGELSDSETPDAETPGTDASDAETPAADGLGGLDDSLDVGELSDSEIPGAETPGTDASDAETPAADGLGGLGDSLDVGELSDSEIPGAETPDAETPGTETADAETPQDPLPAASELGMDLELPNDGNSENEAGAADPTDILAAPATDPSTDELDGLGDLGGVDGLGDMETPQSPQTPVLDSKEEGQAVGGRQEGDERSAEFSECRSHIVLAGETFWKISEKYYGSPAYKDALARYNKDTRSIPGELKAGMTVLIPELEHLRSCYGTYCPRESSTPVAVSGGPARQSVQYYIVQEGDTVIAIAEKCLGDAANWPAIRRLNPDKISSLGILPPGTQLIIPSETSPGSGVWE